MQMMIETELPDDLTTGDRSLWRIEQVQGCFK